MTQAEEDVEQFVKRAAASGKWMVAVFRIEDGRPQVDRTTCNFPTGEFLPAVAMLAANLCDEQERLRGLPPPPLPRAVIPGTQPFGVAGRQGHSIPYGSPPIYPMPADDLPRRMTPGTPAEPCIKSADISEASE